MIERLKLDIKASLDAVAARGAQLYATLFTLEDAGGSRLDRSLAIPATGLSLTQSQERFGALVTYISAIDATDISRLALVSQTALRLIVSDLGNLLGHYNSLFEPIERWITDRITISSLDVSNFSISSSQGTIELGPELNQIESIVDAIIDRAYRIPVVIDATGFQSFSSFSTIAVAAQVKAEQNAAATENANRSAAETAANIARILGFAEEQKSAIDQAGAETQSNSGKVHEIRKKIEDQLTFIESVNSKSEVVKSKVEEFDENFSDFDKKLADRKRAFEEGSALLAQLTKDLSEKAAEADQIIQNARTSLGWATAHGLASGFADSARELDAPLKSARRSTILSFLLLAIWGLFIFFGISTLVPEISLSNLAITKEGMELYLALFSGVLSRLALLAPALFFTFFSLSNYKQTYISREQYIFKKTIAASLPGFKQEANVESSNEIVKGMMAAAYERLLFNPREAISRDLAGSERMGFLSRWLVRLMQAAFEKAKPKA
jgi:hypothetical protein